jgi:cell division protein FtsQ
MNALLRLTVWLLALGVALLPVIAVLNGWLASDRWPIEQLRIHAEYRRVNAEQIRAAVAPQATFGFFAVDLEAVQRALLGLDWVAAAQVRKVWPNRLEITIEEHQPYARWGEDRLLSARGQLFPLPPDGAALALPEFQGGDEHVAEMMRVHGLAAPLFALHGSELVGLRFSARGSWSFRLQDGAVVMAGRGEPMARLERFVPLFAELRAVEQRPLVRADLRYANGFALRWAEAPPVDATEVPTLTYRPPAAARVPIAHNGHALARRGPGGLRSAPALLVDVASSAPSSQWIRIST